MMAALAPIIPGAQAWPKFTRNRSEQFEARCRWWRCWTARAMFFAGMAGSRLPIAVAHGEGLPTSRSAATPPRCTRDALRRPPARPTEAYPANPNGSPDGPDRGDHRRRPLHRADAAPRAGVPQRADELDSGPATGAHHIRRTASPWLRMFRNALAALQALNTPDAVPPWLNGII
jgi:phosphoribosylformylglycinamidine synthase